MQGNGFKFGEQVRIKGITDPCDIDMNGRTGLLCRPVRDQRPIQEVGVRLNEVANRLDFLGEAKHQEVVNVFRHEFEYLEEYE